MEKTVLTIFSFDSVTYGSSSQSEKEGRDKGSVIMTMLIDGNLKRFKLPGSLVEVDMDGPELE
jgi:hypothetical protein